jgi:urease gamma subunit
MSLQDAIYQENIYRQHQKMKKVLVDIAAMQLGGNRTTKGDRENYEQAVSMARAVLVETNRPGGE